MAFKDSTWTRVGWLTTLPICTAKIKVKWNIVNYLYECSAGRTKGKRMMLKSNVFSFADAVWNFFASFDVNETRSQFGINVRACTSDEVLECCCHISFVSIKGNVIKHSIHETTFVFLIGESHWSVSDLLTSCELKQFLRRGNKIVCTIFIKQIYKACSEIENTYSIVSAGSAGTRIVIGVLKKADDEVHPTPGSDCKVLQDLKNLLLTGEGSDVIIQVENQQFKVHRSILTARSSVFAAMFRHDMKEKATGIVIVEDCELSSFPVFLEYLYCGSTEKLSPENVFNLYESADKCDVQDLKRKCLEFMECNLSVDTFCETLRMAVQYSETDLLKRATEFFIKNLKLIIATTKWETFLSENPIQGNGLFKIAADTFK